MQAQKLSVTKASGLGYRSESRNRNNSPGTELQFRVQPSAAAQNSPSFANLPGGGFLRPDLEGVDGGRPVPVGAAGPRSDKTGRPSAIPTGRCGPSARAPTRRVAHG